MNVAELRKVLASADEEAEVLVWNATTATFTDDFLIQPSIQDDSMLLIPHACQREVLGQVPRWIA